MTAYFVAFFLVAAGLGYFLAKIFRKRGVDGFLRENGYSPAPECYISGLEMSAVYPLSRSTRKEDCFLREGHAIYWVSWPLASVGGVVRYTVFQASVGGNLIFEARNSSINKSVLEEGLDHRHSAWLWIDSKSEKEGRILASDDEAMGRLSRWEASLYLSGGGFYLVSAREILEPKNIGAFIADAEWVERFVRKNFFS